MSSPSNGLIASFKKPVPSNPLRRNEACHQCRKRKLKCDARRPCSTCLRSHAYLVDHPPKGAAAPPYPDCSYDEAANDEFEKGEGYKQLESRINELEGLLRDMTIELEATRASKYNPESSSNSSSSQAPSPDAFFDFANTAAQTQTAFASVFAKESRASSSDEITPTALHSDLSWINDMSEEDFIATSNAVLSSSNLDGHPNEAGNNSDNSLPFVGELGVGVNGSTFYTLNSTFRSAPNPTVDAAFFGTGAPELLEAACTANGTIPMPESGQPTYDFQDYDVVHTGWSPHLPSPAITRHLVQAFFAFHINAGRLFHGPTFLASLNLSPLDHRFPSVAVLHALCAIGSMFVADVAPTPIHTGTGFSYVIFHGRWRRVAVRPDSFAEQQAKLSQHALNQFFDAGDHLVSGLQAQLCLVWFYIAQARWSEAFMTCGRTLRSCIPLGMISSGPFQIPPRGTEPGPIIQESRILPLPESFVEEETRRNLFWLAYATERSQAASSNFAMEIDDQDICQMLPVRADQFDLGVQVPVEHRQWSTDRDVLLVHPSRGTDSFVLYIKGCMLLSRVKTWNVRYKHRYQSGDLLLFTQTVPETISKLDPRESVAFQELDSLVMAFRSNLPPDRRVPIQDETVDPHLYSTVMASHLSVILLHDPHINMNDPSCVSANRVIHAARSILQLLYSISSTSYDVSLLDHIAISGWYFAGRSLIRYLHAAIQNNFVAHVVALQAEVSFIYSMLSKAGERMPVAYRYKRLLCDTLAQTCGEEFVDPPAKSNSGDYIPPSESNKAVPAPAKNLLKSFIPPLDSFPSPY